MFKRAFVVSACSALALLLAVAETCPAQGVFIGGNRNGGFFGPIVSFPVGPNYYPNYYRPTTTYMPPTSYSSYSQYTMTQPTPIYYGAASFMPSYSYSSPTARLVAPPPGVGLQGNSNVAEAAFSTSTPAYPVQSPNYNTIYPVSPPLSMITDNTARVEVRLPGAADLWFEGHKTAQTGTDRMFRSPELQAGQDYVYEIRALWDAGGKPVDETRKVTVHAGDHAVVDFRSTSPR